MVELDGELRNAYATSITFSLTLDDLMRGIARAATAGPPERRFHGTLSHNRVAGESYWSERDTEEATAVARGLGPGHIYAATRAALRANGESWRSSDWTDVFPPEAARRRADELFPMLRQEGNPFAPAPPGTEDEPRSI